MAASKLQLQVILSALDKATAPLKRIQGGSLGAAKALKEARDKLKELNTQQKDVSAWRTQRAAAEQTEQSLGAARDKVKQLSREFAATGAPTRQMTRDLKSAIREATALKREHSEQQTQLQGLRTKLNAAGISTRNLGQGERDLRAKIAATNAEISEQGRRMQRLATQQKRLAMAKSQYERTQGIAGSMAGSGAAGLASGYAIARPLKGIVDAFAPAENAATQLKVSMMGSDGSVSADFQKITDLANKLGDRLPGTTADFQEMMTMLRRQGLSAANILGGTGEASAYLGVQLQMPVTAAAELAAKMQDATRTTEKDMMGLMDTIQRTYYMGVDSDNMLQGFSKISPVMDIIKRQGLEATKVLTPLLVMMDQAGMEGGAAGNAYRKVFQGAMNVSRITKTLNDLKAERGLDLSLDFTDGKGEFGGIDQMYAQLEKLKGLSTEVRLQLIKDMFGDDSETLTTLNTMMSKGISGYREVEGKLQDQADLRKRVNEQLGTLTNVMEAAQGSWSNSMAEIGVAIAPELKEFIGVLGEVAIKVKGWVKENPQLTAQLVKTAAGLALLLTVGGGLSIMLASILGPFAMVRLAMMLLGIKSLGLVTGLKALGGALLWVGKAVLLVGRALMLNPIGLAVTAIAAAVYLIYANWDKVGPYFLGLIAEIKQGFSGGLGGIAATILNFSPLGLFYRAFAGVMNYFGAEMPARFTDFGSMLINGMVNGITNGLGSLKTAITGAGESAIGWFKEKLGIHSPSRVFATLGGFTMAGLANGLAGGEGDVLKQIAATAKRLISSGTAMLSGLTTSAENRQPISSVTGDVLKQLPGTTKRLASSGTDMLSGNAIADESHLPISSAVNDVLKQIAGTARRLANSGADMLSGKSISFDSRPPISASAGGMVIQGDTNHFQIHATPGTDVAGLQRMINQMLDERERNKATRIRSRLGDLE